MHSLIDWVSDPDDDDDEYCGRLFEDPTGYESDDLEEDDE